MKRNLIMIFVVLLGLSWFVAVSDAVNHPKKVEEHLAKAAELEAQGIYVDAITEYESALTYEPENAGISLRMANAWLQTGSSKKFVNICKETAEAHPKEPEALDMLMNYYVEKSDELSAVKYLGEFTEKYPENEEAEKWLLKLEGTYEELFCNYEELGEICHDSMVIKKEELYGLADSLGNEIVKPVLTEVHPYSEDDLALVCRDGKYIYIDRDGQTRLAVDEAYSSLGMLSSERTVAVKQGKYGYLDEKLEPVTEFLWDDLTLISDNMGAACRNGKWALVSKNGKEKTEYIFDGVITDDYGFCFGQKKAFVKTQAGVMMVDKKGEQTGELFFEDARCFSEEGYAAVCKNGKWGYVSTDGELVLDYQYEDAQSFHNGFAAVCKDGKWGYIDTSGNMAVDPVFEVATAVSEKGTAAVKQGEWKLIQLNLFR